MKLKIGDKFTSDLYHSEPKGNVFTVVGFFRSSSEELVKGVCDSGNENVNGNYAWLFPVDKVTPLNKEEKEMKYEVGKWYGWNGGECPVPPNTKVRVVFSEDLEYNTGFQDEVREAKYWHWDSEYSPIVAFRIVKEEYKEPREFWILCSGETDIYSHGIYETEEEAKKRAICSDKVIKVREVIGE